jgi:hypothetical protein
MHIPVSHNAPPAGWQPDPYASASWRWWDGSAWSERTAPGFGESGLERVWVAVGKSLLLDQQQGSGTDELRLGESRVGLLEKPFTGDITAHSADGSWILDRQGLTQMRVGIRVLPSNVEVARFEWQGVSAGTYGLLSFPDGRWFQFRQTGDLSYRRIEARPGRSRSPATGSWTFFRHDEIAMVTTRIAWPQPKKKVVFGREVEYTSTSWGTGKSAAEIWTDVHAESSTAAELPLLTLLSTFLVWWTATLAQQVHRRG